MLHCALWCTHTAFIEHQYFCSPKQSIWRTSKNHILDIFQIITTSLSKRATSEGGSALKEKLSVNETEKCRHFRNSFASKDGFKN